MNPKETAPLSPQDQTVTQLSQVGSQQQISEKLNTDSIPNNYPTNAPKKGSVAAIVVWLFVDAVVLIILIISVVLGFQYLNFKNPTVATGTVLSEYSSGCPNSYNCNYYVSYSYAVSGQSYTKNNFSIPYSEYQTTKVGQQISILYSKSNPNQSYTKQDAPNAGMFGLALFLFVVEIIFSFMTLRAINHNRKSEKNSGFYQQSVKN